MQKLGYIKALIFCFINLYSFSQSSFKVVSSSNGKAIKDIVISSKSSHHAIIKDLILKLASNRKNKEALNIYLENKQKTAYNELKPYFKNIGISTIETLKIDYEDENWNILFNELNKNVLTPVILPTIDKENTLIIKDSLRYFLIDYNVNVKKPKIKRSLYRITNKSSLKGINLNSTFIEIKDTFSFKETNLVIDEYIKSNNWDNIKVYFFNSNHKDQKQEAWVQDLFIPVYNKNEIKCWYNQKNLRSKLLDSLVKINQISKETTPFDLQGGNILFLDSNTAFIGKESLIDSTGKIDSVLYDQILKTFELENILVIGFSKQKKDILENYKWQPFFHLDLFITPIKIKDTVHILLGKLYDVDTAHNSFINQLNKDIDTIGYKLCSLNVKIHRIPIGFQNYTYYSFNNMFVETIGDTTYAYTPHYADYLPDSLYTKFKKTISNIKNLTNVFINKGDEVFTKTSQNRGSLHCLINILSRED